MKDLFSSLAFRLISLYVLLFTGLAFVLLGVHYWTTIHAPYTRVRERVLAEAAQLAAVHEDSGLAALQEALGARLGAGGARLPFHALTAPGGQVLTANLQSWPAHTGANWVRLSEYTHLDGETQDYEPLLRDLVFPDGTRLLVGRNIEDIDELEEKLLSVALGVTATGIALGLLGGWLMSRTIARRIAAVTRVAHQVMKGDLSGRIPDSGRSDDFGSLSAVLNEMLVRIENLVESVHRVSDNVAHELRTPLARLRAVLEKQRGAGQEITRSQVEELLADVTSLERTFDAVLRIARIESAAEQADRKQLNLAAVVEDAAELYAPAAEERALQLAVSLPQDLPVRGDRDLLFQSICNLIDNAIKYTPAGGRISIAAQVSANRIEVVIRDSGPGIPIEHRAHVTERFYRMPSTAAAPGVGLGLSLVAAVASRHRSTLLFEDADPGLVIRWQFPPFV